MADVKSKVVHRNAIRAAGILCAVVLSLTTCNIFKTGLGPKVDVTPPELSISSPVPGSYVRGSVVLTGTAADDIGVTSLTATYPRAGGSTGETAIPVTGKTWTVSIPSGVAGGLAEGKDTITVTAKAASGKSSSASVLAYVDNTAPTVLVTTPTSYGASPPIYSAYVDIAGQAYDASPISKVSVTLTHSVQSITKTANGTNNWSVRFLLQSAPDFTLGSGATGDPLSYAVVVTDQAGNASTYYYHSQDIYSLLSTGKLFPTMLEIGQLDQGGSSPSVPTGISSAALTAKRIGNAAASRGNLQFSYSSVPDIQYSNLDKANPSSNVLAPGSVIVGNIVPPANVGAVDTATLQFKLFTQSDFPSGPAQVTLTAANPLPPIPPATTPPQLVLTNLGSSQSFRIALKDSGRNDLPPGQYVVEVIGAAQGSGTADVHLDFGIDSSAPTLTETSVGNSLRLYHAPFSMSGVAASLSGLASLLVEESADGGVTWSTAYNQTSWSDPVNDPWSTTPSVTLPKAGGDGSYTYRLTLTTVNELKAIIYRSVIVDQTPPTVTVTAPTPGAWSSSSSVTTTGSSGDGSGSGVAGVYYLLDSAATDHTAEIAAWPTTNPTGGPTGAWTKAGGIVSAWTGTASLPGEGLNRLWVVAVDQAGNYDTLSVVAATTLSAGTTYTIDTLGTTDFTLAGAASNTVGLTFTATGAGAGTGTAWTGTGQGVTFGYDLAPPNLTVSAVPATLSAATGASFTGFSGTVYDTDPARLPVLAVSALKNGTAVVTNQVIPYPGTSTSSGNPWSWAFAVDVAGHTTDGNWVFTFTATDAAGKTTTVTRSVDIDTTSPTVTLASIPSWLGTSSFTASGSATDPGSGASGISVIQYQLDGGAWANASWTDASGGANTTGTWSAGLSSLIEGNHTIVMRAADGAGNTTTLGSASFGVDLTPPNLAVAAVPDTLTAATAASFTGFSGTLYDTDPAGLPPLSVTSTRNGTLVASNTPIPYPGTSHSSGNPWSWAFPVDLVGHTTDGSWAFTFTATDVAGNVSSTVKSIVIDTEPPVVTVTAPSSGGWVSTTTLSVTGVASDGSGTGVNAVYVKADDLANDHSAEDPTVPANGWTLATGKTSWSASLSLSGEGRKTLWVKAADAAGNMTAAAVALSSRVDFGLDLNPPTLGFTDAVSTLVSAGFSLTGTTTDTNPAGPPTLAVTVDGGASQPVTVTAGSWTDAVTVDAAGHTTDGSHTYVFTTTDVAGKTTTLSRTITVDTRPPTLTIGQPGPYTTGDSQYWLSGATASLGGTAADPGAAASGVSKVYYRLDTLGTSHAADNPVSAGWTLAAGTTTWTATADLGTLGEGQFTLWVAAVDNAGNLSSIFSRDFGVDQNPPTLTETNHAPLSSTKSAYTLAGAVGDTNALASLAITESKDGGSADAVSLSSIPASLAGVKNGTYASQSLPLGGVADGSYAYVLTATDVAGKTVTVTRTVTIDTTPPTVSLNAIPPWVSSSAYTISGTGADPNAGASGVATVQYQLDGGAWTSANWTDTSGGANTSGTWSVTLSALAEGNHSLAVRATDAASNTTTLDAASFGVDLNPPTLTETLLGTTSQVKKNASFTMTGTVGDTNPVSVPGSTLTVSVSVNGGAAVAAALVGATWSYNQAKVDGSYSYLITATDASGKTTALSRLVLLDSTPPMLTTTSPTPSPGSWVSSGALTLSGTALDGAGSGVKKIYYLVDAAAADHNADIAAWNGTSGTTAPSSGTSASWTATTGLPDLWNGSASVAAEGSQALWIVASDNAGNTTTLSRVPAGSLTTGTAYRIAAVGTTDFTAVGASSNTVGVSFTATGPGTGTGSAWTGTGIGVSFGLDLNPPALSETVVSTPATVVRNSSVTFSGSASDTNALAAAHFLTVSVDGGAAADVAFSAQPVWSWTYAVDGVGHTQEGAHTFLFTATDVAGRTTTVSRSVLVDTTPASAAVSSPTSAAWTGASPYTVAGTASDAGSGVSQVWTVVDASANSHAADAPASIQTGAVWKQASGTTNWTASWDLGSQGAKTVWVAVLDAAGNWSTSYTSVSFGYDATPPSLSITPLGGFNSTFSLTGTASDAESGVSSLKYKIDSDAFSAITAAAGWSVPVPAGTFDALAEGQHTVTVQAMDAAGNQTTQATTFSKDTTPPTLSYSTISSGGGTVVQDANPILAGTLTDVSGVASASYTLQVWSYSTSSWNTIASGTSLGTPGGSTNWQWSLNLSATGLNLPDGKYQVAIGAADVPGNAIAAPLSVPFLLSRSSPAAAITAPTLGTFQDAAFPLVGTSSDPNGITQVKATLASGTVDFSSGTTSALPALPVTVTTGSPGTFTASAIHGLNVGDQVYLWGTPMPSTPAGLLQTGTVYYVQSVPSSTAFTIAATSGGPALAIASSTATDVVVGIAKDAFTTFTPATPVTVSGDTMTAPNHRLVNGDVVYFQGASLPAPVSAATAYYVVNAATGTFQVSTTSGGSVLTLTTSGSGVSVSSPTRAVSWMVPALSVGGQSEGALTAWVQVSAGSGKINQTSRDFTLDTVAPSIAVSSPTSGTRSVGNLTLVGTTNDLGSIPSGVTGTIQYQVGKNYNLGNPASWTSANVTGGSYSWTITLGDMSSYANATFATECRADGTPASGTNLWKLPIVFQAQDKAGNVGQWTPYYLILDPDGNVPVVTVTQPATGLTFGGQQTIAGTATQPVAIYGVEIAVDPAGGTNFPATPVSVSIGGSTLTATGHPFTTGMMVFLSGTTAPQISGLPVPSTTPYWVMSPTATTFQVSAASGGSPVTFSSAGSGVTASVWAPATLTTTGNNVIWYYNINTTTAYPQGGATSQTITVQARAWNSPTLGGPKGTISGLLATPLSMTFNSSFPQVQNVQVDGQSYYSQITASGSVSVTATIGSSKGIAKLEAVESSPLNGSTPMYNTAESYTTTAAAKAPYWSSTVTPPATQTSATFGSDNTIKVMITATGSNPSLWTAAGAPATIPGTVFVPSNVAIDVGATGGSFIESDVSGTFTYSLAMTIDSTALYSGVTGQYVFNIRATDMTSPVAEVTNQPITIDEDNYYPTASIVSSASMVGSQFVIQGSATDTGAGSGPISGFSRVVVYLVRGGTVLNLSTGVGGATSTLPAKNMAHGGLIENVVYPGAGASLKLSIDTLAENNTLPTGGGTDANGDGFMESLTINGSSYTWMGQVDSTKIPDGPAQLHYVAVDGAGNATHYVQDIVIGNYAPSLSSVVLGTDLTGGGSISTTASYSSGYLATGFTARNRLLSFQVNNAYGGQNGALGYSLTYAGTEYWADAPAAGETVSGVTTGSATLTLDFTRLSPAIPDSAVNGASFTLTVTASPAAGGTQTYSQTINLTVKNNDTTPPTISAAPFGQRYSVPTDAAHGGAYTDTGKTLGPVSAYADNVATSGSTLLGHVEYSSPYTGGASALSGQVIFRGKAYDDQRISRLTAAIPGFNGGNGTGVEFEIAKWGITNLVGESGTGWSFATDASSEGVTLADGHALNWGLTVDTSLITGGAQKNVSVTFTAYDFWTWGTATRPTTSTLTSSILNGMSIPNGTPIQVGTTWTTVTDFAGTTITFATAVNPASTSFVLANTGTSTPLAVDVVPYVSSVQRNASLYNTNRSRYGKYPVAQGETGVVISGFNLLASTTQDANNWVRTYNAKTGGTADVALTVTAAPGRSQFTATVATNQHSGWLRLAVNNVEAINNSDDNTASWNRMDDGSGIAATKWTDDLYLSVWNVNQWANGNAFAGSANSQYPTFTVDSSGTLYGAWINYANATVSYNTVAGTNGAAGTSADVFKLYDPSEFVDISIDPANNNPAIAYIQNTYGGSGAWSNLNSGSVNVWVSDITKNNNNELWEAYQNNPLWVYYGFLTDGLWHNSQLWEYYGVKVVRSGNNLHVVWYDDSTKSVKYAYFVSTQNVARGGAAGNYYVQEQPWINLDGSRDGADVNYADTPQFTAGISRVASVGQSVSIDVDKNNDPVIGYYDNVNHVMRVAYANSATPTAVANWHIQAVHPSGDSLDSFAGANSGDKNGNLTIRINHTSGSVYLISYRPTKGQLIYTTAAARGAGDFSFGASSVLDTNGNVGSWSAMSVNTASDIPAMVYQNKNGLGTDDGVKVAYWDTTLSTPDWETVIAPATTFVDDGKLSIVYNNGYTGVPWTLAVGFKSTAFQVMYLQPQN